MASGTVYLDVDDEITSAAARIRGSEATKVALVVPYGSRIATSRMNFRLLSREAVVNNRRLSIVASDAATRALAASAGLPVFASVAEYDAASAPIDPAKAETPPVAPAPAADPEDKRGAGGAAITATAAGAAAAGAAATPPAATKPKSKSKARAASKPAPAGDETQKIVVPPAAAMAAAAAIPAGAATVGPGSSVTAAPTVRVPVIRGRRMPTVAPIVLAVAGIAVLGVVALAVAAYVFLPSAEITLTPKEEPIPPISLTVRADPDATATDAEAGVVPAERLEVPVEVSNTFQTQGRRVEEGNATGTVTFRNVDFTESNTIAAGSIVSTQSGVRFRLDRAVTVGRAQLVGLQVIPTEADVSVTASEPGTAGNVEPNTITVIPAAEDPTTLSVRNKAATSGGTHEEFPQVSEAEVNAALEQLNAQLADAFAAAVADGAGKPANAILYPETAVLGTSTPTVDPTTLVGQELASFDLGVDATGTVIAVDSSPVETIAESRILANVGAGYRLVDGSIDIDAGEGTVSNGQVTFPVTASATRVRILDPAELLGLVKGRSLEDAEAALAPFGRVEIAPWPDWVSSIPTMDGRVSLVIVGQEDAADGADASEPPGSASPGSASPGADGSP
ncbi:MAG TPA: baseplate J/gp47 family protein [Candidatus Limnocylindrales bacterium]|nr:baseplate J/gp47 family protein [Candidatus Limnocylindrales bacterium]